jgi:hypothetical protein
MLVAGPTVMHQHLGIRRPGNVASRRERGSQSKRRLEDTRQESCGVSFDLLPRVNPINVGRAILSIYVYSGLLHGITEYSH